MKLTDRTQPLERVASGISGLDIILGGGFFRGGMYLIQGTPGTGKTTLANQICFHRIGLGDKALYVTLLAEYHARMVQYVGRLSFFDPSKLPDDLVYVSGFRVMREQGLAALLSLIRRELITRKAGTLVVDGLIAAQRAAESDQSFNEFVHELQGIALATDCTVFLVASSQRQTHSTPEHTMVDGIIELSDQKAGWATERVLEVAKIRGSSYLRGRHTYRITDDGLVMYPRIEALLARPSLPDREVKGRVSSGVAQLDAMLGGGLPAGSSTMLLGPSGVGKTTFGLQFLSASTAAAPGLLMGFYEPASRILAKARGVCPNLVTRMEQGVVSMIWQPPTDESLDAYGERLLSAVRVGGVRRVFIDGLGALHCATNADSRMRQFLPALTNELRVQGVTTLYSLEAGNIVGPETSSEFGDLSVLAENLLLLRYVELSSRLRRLVSILKVRDSDFDPFLHEFVLTHQGPQITEAPHSAEHVFNPASPNARSP